MLRRDKQFYRPCLTRRSPDEAKSFELNDHLVGARRRDTEEALKIGFGGRLAIEE